MANLKLRRIVTNAQAIQEQYNEYLDNYRWDYAYCDCPDCYFIPPGPDTTKGVGWGFEAYPLGEFEADCE